MLNGSPSTQCGFHPINYWDHKKELDAQRKMEKNWMSFSFLILSNKWIMGVTLL